MSFTSPLPLWIHLINFIYDDVKQSRFTRKNSNTNAFKSDSNTGSLRTKLRAEFRSQEIFDSTKRYVRVEQMAINVQWLQTVRQKFVLSLLIDILRI